MLVGVESNWFAFGTDEVAVSKALCDCKRRRHFGYAHGRRRKGINIVWENAAYVFGMHLGKAIKRRRTTERVEK